MPNGQIAEKQQHIDGYCSSCIHKEVCSIKGDFEKAQNAINDFAVNLGKSEDGYAFKYLCDFDFIEQVKLRCKHYSPCKTYR